MTYLLSIRNQIVKLVKYFFTVPLLEILSLKAGSHIIDTIVAIATIANMFLSSALANVVD